MNGWVYRIGGMILTGQKRSTGITFSSSTYLTTNPIWTALGLDPIPHFAGRCRRLASDWPSRLHLVFITEWVLLYVMMEVKIATETSCLFNHKDSKENVCNCSNTSGGLGNNICRIYRLNVKGKGSCKFNIEESMKAQTGSGGITTLSLTSTIHGWVINATPRPLYPRERTGIYCVGGWFVPRAGLDGRGKSVPHRDSMPRFRSPQRVARFI
jgi:hypothetical protein